MLAANYTVHFRYVTHLCSAHIIAAMYCADIKKYEINFLRSRVKSCLNAVRIAFSFYGFQHFLSPFFIMEVFFVPSFVRALSMGNRFALVCDELLLLMKHAC